MNASAKTGSMQPAFGRATASTVSAMPDQRKVYGMYRGMQPITLLVSRFLREHSDSAIERKAGELLRELDQAGNREECCASMEGLARKGSLLAAYVLAVARLNGRYVEKDEKAAMKALMALCRQKFPPAFAQLADTLTPRDLSLPKGRAFLPLVKKGNSMGDARCLLLSALAWMEGWIVPSPRESMTIVKNLYEAAYTGSWDCLATLLQMFEVIPPGDLLDDVHNDALELARMAALDGMPEAMATYGRILASSGTPQACDGLPWLEKSWKAGSLMGGVEYAKALQEIRGDKPEALEEARRVLEECCEQIYPDAMAHLGLMEIRANKSGGLCVPGLDLMRHAARLGSTELYVETLWEAIVMGLNKPDVLDECVKRLKELVRDHNDRGARLRLAQYDLYVRNIPAPGEKHPIARLEELAGEGEKRACTLLATIYTYGFHGIEYDDRKAAYWLDQALIRHDIRASSLLVYETMRQLDSKSKAEREEQYEEFGPLIKWLFFRHRDKLALTVAAIEEGLLHAPEAGDFFESLEKEKADRLARQLAGFFRVVIKSGLRQGDLATLRAVVQAFACSRGCDMHQRIASLVLEDWKTLHTNPKAPPCRALAKVCLAFLIGYGEIELLQMAFTNTKGRQ